MNAILGWVAIGLIAGLFGKLLMPGRDPGGLIVPALLGIAGAILGGLTTKATGIHSHTHLASLIGAIIGAATLLLLYRFVMKRRG